MTFSYHLSLDTMTSYYLEKLKYSVFSRTVTEYECCHHPSSSKSGLFFLLSNACKNSPCHLKLLSFQFSNHRNHEACSIFRKSSNIFWSPYLITTLFNIMTKLSQLYLHWFNSFSPTNKFCFIKDKVFF